MPKPPLTNERRVGGTPFRLPSELLPGATPPKGNAGGPISPSPLASMAASSPPGRHHPGPGSAGMMEPRQLTPEDMNLIVAGSSLQTRETSQMSSLKPREIPNTHDRSQSRESNQSDLPGCFHVRHVQVTELLEDGTLGLLLHGTSVVGFCSSKAESAGWRVGDQIVEVNGQRVGSFDEFLEFFVDAQSKHGLPIDFSVLRRELRASAGEKDEAEESLENFFSATNFVDLAGQLQRKFGPTERGSTGGSDEDYGHIIRSEAVSILENPYIQALRRRRDELVMNTESWSGTVGTPHSASIASRLATRKDAGIASFEDHDPLAETRTGPLRPCGWPFCTASGSRSMGCREAIPMNEVTQTPRMDAFDALQGIEASVESSCSSAAPRDCQKAPKSWANFNAFVSTPRSNTGALSGRAAGSTPQGILAGSEKENSMNTEGKQDRIIDAPAPDDLKAAGDEQSGIAAQNFAARLLPLGAGR